MQTLPIIRVLCVDDHTLMREGIVRIVALHRDVRVVATTGKTPSSSSCDTGRT